MIEGPPGGAPLESGRTPVRPAGPARRGPPSAAGEARVAAAILAVMAALLYFGVVSPLNGRATALVEAHRRAREERREARVRLRSAELREDVRRRAAALVRDSPAPADEVARGVRARVVAALGGARDVSLSVTPGGEGVRVQLGLTASEEEAFALLGRLSAPDVGLILQEVRLGRGERGMQLSVSGVAFGGVA